MPRRPVISYTPGSTASSAYYLATTSDCMQFYCFEEPLEDGGEWQLINELDRTRLLGAGDKATAKTWAKRLRLKSWTYVRV